MRIAHAHWGVPQMAVFSNGFMVGMIQIFGVGGMVNEPVLVPGVDGEFICYPYVRKYRLYIPREFLNAGDNSLRLRAVRSFSGTGPMENQHTWWIWDYVRLWELTAPASEPVHGHRFHLGTLIANPQFHFGQNVTHHLGSLLKWLGIAHSGNVMRVSYWSDVGVPEAAGLAYLKEMKAYNMRVVGNHLSYKEEENRLDENGQLPTVATDKLDGYLTTYGNLIQFYEIDNEPKPDERITWGKAVAGYLRNGAPTPAHLKLVAPGWTFEDGFWAQNPNNRRGYEDLCDLINGHSYGRTYANPNRPEGSSFTQALLVYGDELTIDGLPKLMLVTETGTTNTQTDFEDFGATQPKAAMFDRILRAHVGFADRVMQHVAFFPDEYQLFKEADWTNQDPGQFEAYEFGPNNPTTRVDIFRRIACAYATHGKPLAYDYLNRPMLQNRMVYTRAVNTATLPALPGSGGKSNQVLINVVNFDSIWLDVSLRVVMPSSGRWSGDRYGGGLTYAAARSAVQRDTVPTTDGPAIELNPTLAPGEAVQFILALE